MFLCFRPALKPNRKTTETQLVAILDRPKPDRLLEEWLAGDATKLRQEVDRCCRELAESIVEEIFLLYLPEKEFLFFRPEKQEE